MTRVTLSKRLGKQKDLGGKYKLERQKETLAVFEVHKAIF